MAGDEDEIGESDAWSFRVPCLLRAVEVLSADGSRVGGQVFLPALAEHQPWDVQLEAWLNDTEDFFPFLPDGDGSAVILNKRRIVALTTVAASETPVDAGPAPTRRVMVECGGVRVEGIVVLDMPAHQMRVLDLLNRPGAFLLVHEGDRHHLVRKSRITGVHDVPEPARTG